MRSSRSIHEGVFVISRAVIVINDNAILGGELMQVILFAGWGK